MTPSTGRLRMIAVAALLLTVAMSLPRFLTHSPMRLGIEAEWWEEGAPRVIGVVGPPAQGRLEEGDRILSINDLSTATVEERRQAFAKGMPSGPLTMVVERGGERVTITLPPMWLSAWERLRIVLFRIAAFLVVPLVAFVLIWRRPDLHVAWLFMWFACIQAMGAVWGFFRHPMMEMAGPLKLYDTGFTILVWWYPATFLHFMAMFPRARWTPATRWRSPWFWIVAAAYLYPLVVWSVFGGSEPPDAFYGVYQAIVFPLAVVSLIARYARPSRGEWQPRMSERVLAIIVGVTMFLGPVFGFLIESSGLVTLLSSSFIRLTLIVIYIAWLLAPLLIAYLIANDPIFDPRRVLVQSLPYALLTGVLAALYLGIVLGGQRVFATLTGEEALVFNLIAALVIAFAFAPLRERLQRGLDHVFGRDTKAMRAAVDKAGHELLGASSREEVRAVVDGALGKALKRDVATDWQGKGPRLVEGEVIPADARPCVDNLFAQARMRLESLSLQEARAAAERHAVELREAATRAELRALHAQVQPHFLFNALNALSYLTETDPSAAQRFTERLADMLRYTVEAGTRKAALLSEEIQFVEDYLGVARERYESDLSFEYQGPKELLSASVPPLLLQPLVENSLKHGCPDGAKALHLRLAARDDHGWLCLEFSDDGAVNGSNPPGLGVGLQNLQQRVVRFGGPNARLESGSRNGGGYCVRMRWPMLSMVA